MMFLGETCFCDPACGDFEVDDFGVCEAGLQYAGTAVFPFGESDEADLGLFDDAPEYAYQMDQDWGDETSELGDVITYDEEDQVEKVEKTAYGTGVEAKRLRAVNVKSPDLVLYKRAVEEMAGRVRKPRLQELADAFRDQYHISIGRDGRRGLWSLWRFFKDQFPNPVDFVAFLST